MTDDNDSDTNSMNESDQETTVVDNKTLCYEKD